MNRSLAGRITAEQAASIVSEARANITVLRLDVLRGALDTWLSSARGQGCSCQHDDRDHCGRVQSRGRSARLEACACPCHRGGRS